MSKPDSLERCRNAAQRFYDCDTIADDFGLVTQIVTAFSALDKHLSAGGDLPAEWRGTRSTVLCVRDPDAANEFTLDGQPVRIEDVDLGHLDLGDKVERAEWLECNEPRIALLRQMGATNCADALETIVKEVKGREP